MKKLTRIAVAVMLSLSLVFCFAAFAAAEPETEDTAEVTTTAEEAEVTTEAASEEVAATEDTASADTAETEEAATTQNKGLWKSFVGLFEKILKGIRKLIPSYGLSIVIFSLLIKLIMVPLDIKSKRSMMRISSLQPEINRLQEKYKNDKDKLSQKQMELYKKNNVSPMAGCLPMLIQLPLFFAFFAALRNVSTEMSAFPEAFLWIKNIWAPDSPMYSPEGVKIAFSFTEGNGYFILAVLSGVTSFLYTKQSQKDSPQQTQKNENGMDMNFMSYLMPIISVWWTAMYTASFGVYWVTSNVFMMLSSYLIKRYLDKTEGTKVVQSAD